MEYLISPYIFKLCLSENSETLVLQGFQSTSILFFTSTLLNSYKIGFRKIIDQFLLILSFFMGLEVIFFNLLGFSETLISILTNYLLI